MKNIIIGYLLSQLITLIVFLITKENDRKAAIAGSWTFFLPVLLLANAIRVTRNWYIRKLYVAVGLRKEGTNHFFGYNNNIRVSARDFKKFYLKGENEMYVDRLKGKYIERTPKLKRLKGQGEVTEQYIRKNFMRES